MITESEYEEFFFKEGFEKAKQLYGGNEEMTFLMIEKFIDETYTKENLKKCTQKIKTKEWEEFRKMIHSIKGRLKYFF